MKRVFHKEPSTIPVLLALIVLSGIVFPGQESVFGQAIPSNSVRRVQQALEQEVNGNISERNRLLELTIAEDPTFPAAHWHLGQVLIRREWISVEELAEKAKNVPLLTEYESLRDKAGETPDGQFALATWCQTNGLEMQAHAHFTRVLELAPDHAGARAQLGFSLINRAWVSQEEVNANRQRSNQAVLALNKWGPMLEQLATLIEKGKEKDRREEAIEKIREIKDPMAIVALEAVASRHSPRFALLVVEQFSQMKAPEGTIALARQAVFSPSKSVRRKAIECLKSRDWNQFIPSLLSAMKTPVQSRAALVVLPLGRIQPREVLVREGQDHRELMVIDSELTAGGAARRDQVAVARENLRTLLVNRAICRVLAGVTDHVKVPTDPRYWWEWWQDYNEIYVEGAKPIQFRYARREGPRPNVTTNRNPSTGRGIPANFLRSDCLAAGTPVWTNRGSISVEKLQVGDVVLSQDPETGNLAYKPILGTTIRPKGDLKRIQVAGETFECSGGHPLWVSGKGWQKARDLKSDDLLHLLNGAERITAIEAGAHVETYNLIVADFHTYFIGQSKILSHDNTVRQPTSAIIPGLVVD